MAAPKELHPCYHPTTILLVDDDKNFLTNLGLRLEEDIPYRMFTSPHEALEHIGQQSQIAPLYERCFSEYRDSNNFPVSGCAIQFDLEKISREMFNVQRFSEISVVVVDYDMPEMDGLAFCRRIKDRNIKKILLTGVADEKVAVQAFNEGIIDRFITKSDQNAAALVNENVKELQSRYFKSISDMMVRALDLTSLFCPHDEAFNTFFEQLREERNIVEYYLISEPEGFLLISRDGHRYILMVQTTESLKHHWEVACSERAPQELLEKLRSGEYVPYFWKSGGFYQEGCEDWESYLYPAKEFVGKQRYSYALLENPDFYFAAPGDILTFDEYLDIADKVKGVAS